MRVLPKREAAAKDKRRRVAAMAPRAATPAPLPSAAQALREVILASDDRIREATKWNSASYFTTEHFATFDLRAPNRVRLVLHLGARPRRDANVRNAVADLDVPLDWKSPDRAILTVASVDDVRRQAAVLSELVRRWIRHVE